MTARARRRIYETTTDATLGRGRKSLMAALGALLLVFNILGGIALGLAAPTPRFADLAEGQIVVCTASGMVLLDRDGHKTPPPQRHGDAQCSFCLPLIGGAAMAAATFEFVAIRALYTRASAPAPVALAVLRRLSLAALARGPPA